MIINQTYPYPGKLHFVFTNILTFLYRVAVIHVVRVTSESQKKNAHKQLMETREMKSKLSNSNKEISESEIEAIQVMEKELECIRDSDIVVKDIEDDELTDIAMKFERVLNWFLIAIDFLIVKPAIFIIKYLWRYGCIYVSVIYEEIVIYIKKRKLKKELFEQAIPVNPDETLSITTS